MKGLNYIFLGSTSKISLNLYEAEKYEHAVVVHPLVGGLIMYDNLGNFVPFLAKSWTVNENGVWSFLLHSGLKCENGEEITPASFKKSLEISLKAISKNIDYPIFKELKGYKDFMQNSASEIVGIAATNTDLQFHFAKNIRDGLLQTLTIAPFGYICSENRHDDGMWKDDHKFLSSGPYKVVSHNPGYSHVLALRNEWPLGRPGCVEKVNFYFSFDQVVDSSLPTILDFRTKTPTNIPQDFRLYELYPEYCPTIIMNPKSPNHFFADLKNRIALKNAIIKIQDAMPDKINGMSKAKFLFENQPPKNQVLQETTEINTPSTELIVFGEEPTSGTVGFPILGILQKALSFLGWNYRFNNAEKKPQNIAAGDYDLRLATSSYGYGAEAWILDFIFFSEIDIQLPDPSGRVKKAITNFDDGSYTEKEFADEVNQAIYDDAAVIPIGHYGIKLYLSKEIPLRDLSPYIRVMRFDQLTLQ